MTVFKIETVKNIGLFLCFIAVIFIFVEFFIVRGLLGLKSPRDFKIIEYDKNLGWKLKKNFEGKWTWLEWNDVYYRTNSNGFRDSEHYLPKEKRIIILGDSIAEGVGVTQDEIFPALLSNRLAGHFEIFNLGIRAYDVLQEYKALREIGLKYEPDIVIQVLCDNDYGSENMSPSMALDRYLFFRPMYQIKDTEVIFDDNIDKPYLCNELERAKIVARCISALRRSAALTYMKLLIVTFRDYIEEELNIGNRRENTSSEYEKNYEKAVRNIYKDVNNLRKKHKFEFVMITLWYKGEAPYALREIARENEILFLNISLAPKERFRYDHHPNRAGHQKIADEIVTFMVNNNLL